MSKKIIFLIFVLLFTFFGLKYLNEGKDLIKIVKLAKLNFFLLALLLQVVFYFFYSVLHQKILAIYKINCSLEKVASLVLGSLFVSLLVPLGSLAGSSVFITAGKKEQISKTKSSSAVLLILFVDFLSLLVLLCAGFGTLIIKKDVLEYQLIGLLLFLLMTLGLFVLLVLGQASPKSISKLVDLLHKFVNRFSRFFPTAKMLSKDWPTKKSEEVIYLSKTFWSNKKTIIRSFWVVLTAHFIELLVLFFVFMAFGTVVTPGVLFAGYSIGVLFWIISPTPQGIGIVESVMPLVFVSLGVDIGVATLTTLTFRGLTIWLPAFLGFFSLKFLV